MSSLTKELEDELGRIKTALEERFVITVNAIEDKYDAVVKAALRKLPAKIDCSSLVKDDLADRWLCLYCKVSIHVMFSKMHSNPQGCRLIVTK